MYHSPFTEYISTLGKTFESSSKLSLKEYDIIDLFDSVERGLFVETSIWVVINNKITPESINLRGVEYYRILGNMR